MKQLLILDQKDYEKSMPVKEVTAVRGVVVHYDRIAFQKSRSGVYKLLGGGVEGEESVLDALKRELKEEAGFLLRPETVAPLGEIVEIHRDLKDPGQIYQRRSFYFLCRIQSHRVSPTLTESEKLAGFLPVFERPDKVIEENLRLLSKAWELRDTFFLQMLLQGEITANGRPVFPVKSNVKLG